MRSEGVCEKYYVTKKSAKLFITKEQQLYKETALKRREGGISLYMKIESESFRGRSVDLFWPLKMSRIDICMKACSEIATTEQI